MVWLYILPCSATAVFVVITPTGIVIGADGKAVSPPSCGRKGPMITSTALKVILLKRTFALGDISTEKVTFEDDGTVLYDFPIWAKYIDDHLTTDASVSGLTRIVKEEAPRALSPAFKELDRYACLWEHGGSMENRVLAQYVITGYEHGVPLVSSVELYPDWKGHRAELLSQVPHQLPKGQDSDARYYAFGVDDPRSAICDTHTDANQATVSTSAQRTAFCSVKFPRLSLKEASEMVRFLLEFETRIESEYVGFPFTVITIPKAASSSGQVRTFCHTLLSGSDRLSRQHDGKQD